MARRPNTISQRIALEGGKEIERELKALGIAGEVALRKLQQEAAKLKGVDGFTASLQKAQKQLQDLGKSFEAAGRRLRSTGRALSLAITLPIVGGFTAAIKAATDFESAMADVRKVVDFPTPQAFKELGDDLRELSLRIPVAADGLAAIAAAAGQAGVPREELKEFTELIAQASTAFNLTADEAGIAFAKIKSSLNLTTPAVRLLADAMNHLANNMATSESEVLEVVRATSAVGNVAGLATKDIAAFGAAMVASNVPAEKAATGFRNLILAISAGESATSAQGAAWEQLGLTAVDVAKRIQTEGAGMIVEILERINRLAPHVRVSVLQALGGKRMIDAIAPLVNNMGRLHQALGLVGDEAEFAGSTLREFEIRSDTAANKFQLLRNHLNNLAIVIGAEVLPVVLELTEKITGFLKTLSDSEATMIRWGAVIAAIAAAVGPFVFVLGALTTALGKVITMAAAVIRVFLALKTAIAIAGLGATIASIANPVGAVLAAVGLLAGGIFLLSRAFSDSRTAADAHRIALASLRDAVKAVEDGVPGAIEQVEELGKAHIEAGLAAIQHAEAEVAAQRTMLAQQLEMAVGSEEAQRRLATGDFFAPALDAALADLAERRRDLKQTFAEISSASVKAAQDLGKIDGAAGDAGQAALGAGEKIIRIIRGMEVSEVVVDSFGRVVRTIEAVGKEAEKTGKKTKKAASDISRDFGDAAKGTNEFGEQVDEWGRRLERSSKRISAAVRSVPEEFRKIAPAAIDAEAATVTTMDAAAASTDALAGKINAVPDVLAEVGTAVTGALEPVKTAFTDAAASTAILGSAATETFGGIAAAAAGTADNLSTPFETATAAIAAAFASAFERVKSDLNGLVSAVTSAIARISAALASLRAQIAATRAAAASAGGGGGGSGFAAGGYVLGPGGPRDDKIPARLSNREYVVQAPSTEYYGVPFLHMINQRLLPQNILELLKRAVRGFRDGGLALSFDGFADRVNHSLVPVQSFAGGGVAVAAAGATSGGSGNPFAGMARIDRLVIPGVGETPAFLPVDVVKTLVRHSRRKSYSSAGQRQEFVP